MIKSWADMECLEYSDKYHCEHFTIDAYRFLTDLDISQKLLTGNTAGVTNMRNFKQISQPTEYCLVLFRGYNQAHIGLWHDNKVLHLDRRGVVMQSLDAAKTGFKRVVFYEVI